MAFDTYTKSLLHMNEADASTAFTDEIGKTWTANGNAQIDTAQYKFGPSSGLFDGTTDWIDTPDHADFTVADGNFTIDMWVKRNSAGALGYLCGQCNSAATATTISWFMYFNASNKLVGGVNVGSSAVAATSTGSITNDGNFYHIALVRNGATLTLYIDGTADGTANISTSSANDSATKVAVGRLGELASNTFNGWIDEFRFSNGVARWTTDFSRPIGAYSPLKRRGMMNII